MKLTLPWPPSVNHYWRSYHGIVVLSERGKAFRKNTEAAIFEQHGRLEPIQERCRVTIRAFPGTRRQFDLDNLCKATLDSLHHCRVIKDDSLIDHLTVIRDFVSKDNPRVEVTVEEMVP